MVNDGHVHYDPVVGATFEAIVQQIPKESQYTGPRRLIYPYAYSGHDRPRILAT